MKVAQHLFLSAFAIAVALVIAPPTAQADSVSVSTRDAGGGTVEAVVQISVSCPGSCAWFAHAVERHSSLPCATDTTFIRWVGSFHEAPGAATESFVFRPFFPRATKLCVFLSRPGAAPAEAVISLPAGYGAQRSTGNNCSNFGSQAAAQYYLYLYPTDPSNLDGDNDGSACEGNPCPCGAERIPPEPEPAVAPLPPVSTGIGAIKPRAVLPPVVRLGSCRKVVVASRSGSWRPSAPDGNGFPGRIRLTLTGVAGPAAGRESTKTVSALGQGVVRWTARPGRYRVRIKYLGDEWHRPSLTTVLDFGLNRCVEGGRR